ncbi:hypothetical protein [Sorangium sp. So ce124]|uniref:hypothetical protein n=1 Tax=Sorangium sp. So ce124 TaxID=3133280 RepID=UPI003F61389D
MDAYKPLRVFGIIVCMVLIVLPAWLCFRGPHPQMSKSIDVMFALLPVVIVVFGQLCIAEGRARERAVRERRARPDE